MPIIFKASTSEGYIIKNLSELLNSNLKTACFEITENGMYLYMPDPKCFTLFQLDLYKFENYKFDTKYNCDFKYRPDKLYIGLNLGHLHKMLKSVKKKDSIIMFIDSDQPTKFGIKIIPKDNNRTTTSYINIQPLPGTRIEAPVGYDKPIIVLSNEFQKMCKDMSSISDITNISSDEYQLKFSCNGAGVYSKEVCFGNKDEDESNHSIKNYSEDYSTEQLVKIIKISGLSKNIQIFTGTDLPTLFRTEAGSIGTISIYLKDMKQMEDAKRIFLNDSDV